MDMVTGGSGGTTPGKGGVRGREPPGKFLKIALQKTILSYLKLPFHCFKTQLKPEFLLVVFLSLRVLENVFFNIEVIEVWNFRANHTISLCSERYGRDTKFFTRCNYY